MYVCTLKQMIKYIPIIHDQPQVYTLLIKGLIMANFPSVIEELQYGAA